MSIPSSFYPMGLGDLPPLPEGWHHVKSVTIPQLDSGTKTILSYRVTPVDYFLASEDVRLDLYMGLSNSKSEALSLTSASYVAFGSDWDYSAIGAYYTVWTQNKKYHRLGFYANDDYYTLINFTTPPLGIIHYSLYEGLGVITDETKQLYSYNMRGKTAKRNYFDFKIIQTANCDLTIYKSHFETVGFSTTWYPVHNDLTMKGGIFDLYKNTVYVI